MAGEIASLGQDIWADRLDADVCVIGSGPGGGLLAAELATLGREVLLLEAGGRDPSDPTLLGLGELDIKGDTDLQYARARQVGGSSNLWAGRVAVFDPIDFESRSWVPHSGWPIGYADLDAYYECARRLIGLSGETPSITPPKALPGLSAAVEQNELEVKSFEWSRPPFKVATHLEAALARTDRLRILFNAPVLELRESADGRTIEAAVLRRPDGRLTEVHARQFVVAAGGIETPRLLLASQGRSENGVGNGRDLVGRYFSTHPKADMAALVLNRPVSVADPLFADRKTASGAILRAGVGFTADFQRRHQLLNHYVQLSPFMEFRASRAFEMMKRSSALQAPLIQKNALARGLLPGLGLMAFNAIGKFGAIQPRARSFVLRAFLDQQPDADNRVTLSDQRDAFGAPKADLRWRLTEADRRSILDFFTALDGKVREHGIGRVEYGGLKEAGEWPITAMHSHFMGTTRMGDSDRTGVVDADCRVFGVENLYISGPSVFPTYGFANPFLTIAALALRLAGHLGKA